MDEPSSRLLQPADAAPAHAFWGGRALPAHQVSRGAFGAAMQRERLVGQVLRGSLIFLATCCGGSGESSPDDPTPIAGASANPCAVPVISMLATSETTVFGVNGADLAASVLPAAQSPLYWVAYDGPSFTPAYAPGPGMTTIVLQMDVRDDAEVTQTVWSPPPNDPEYQCGTTLVSIPVHVGLSTTDGAFNEQSDAELEFTSRGAATLHATFAAPFSGTFAFTPGTALDALQLVGMDSNMRLWPGGSSGRLSPKFQMQGANAPVVAGPGSPAASERGPGPDLEPWEPQHWNDVAVWPRTARCDQGAVQDAADRFAGWSPQQAVAELAARSQRTLQTANGNMSVEFTLQTPEGSFCAQDDYPNSGDWTFPVDARLRATQAPKGSNLARLDATARYWLSVHGDGDPSDIVSFHWERDPLTLSAQSADELVSAIGVQLTPADPSSRFMWNWRASDQLAADAMTTAPAWTSSGQLTIQSAIVDPAECQAQPQLAGSDPPPALSCTAIDFVAPGATLVEANLVP
jgi:hypothetical protein